MGSSSIFKLTLSKPHSFFIMTTRTITGRSTRNSRNAGSVPGIAFGRTIPPRVSTPRRLPSVPPSESQFEELGSEHGDGNHGDEDEELGGDFGDGNPEGPGNDPPDDNGPGDHHDDEDPYDDGNQPNLADAIAALARNVGSQRESSRTKVREPDPFDGMDLAKLWTFLVQLQLSFNDQPSAFSNGRRKVEPKINIPLINAAAFLWACSLPGSQQFSLNLADIEVSSHSASTSKLPDPVDLSNVPEEYHEFADVFDKAKAQTLAPHRPYDLKINLEEGYTPPLRQVYSLSQTGLKALQEFLDENLAVGFISSTRSLHGAPVLFVKKKDGGLRLCVDFRGLNKITKKDRYPLPLITDLLDSPGKAKIYTKIDLQHAYHLVRIAKGDEWKMAFWTRYRSFEWKVMPFGLTNAPAAFQHFMNDIFADMVDICVIIYLDDILVYSDNIDQHRTHVHEVLRWLRKNGLYAGAHKCSFHQDTMEYLGYILSPSGLTMDPAKVQTIQDWPEPCKIKEIQSFLGFTNFTVGSYMPTQISLFLLPSSPTKTPSGISQKSVEKCSMTSRRLFSRLRC